jgi:hypothetical protein
MSDARFAGVDWARAEHAGRVVDEQGRIVDGAGFVMATRGSARCSRAGAGVRDQSSDEGDRPLALAPLARRLQYTIGSPRSLNGAGMAGAEVQYVESRVTARRVGRRRRGRYPSPGCSD